MPLLVLLVVVIAILILAAEPAATAALITRPEPVGQKALTGFDLSPTEADTIVSVADEFGVDARLLGAIRRAEMGGPGREFGVLSVAAPSYLDQARAAARTIRRVMGVYEETFGVNPIGTDGRLTPEFLAYFSRGGPGYPGYAPLNASNDPLGLNVNHLPNLLAWYGRLDVVPV